MSEADDTVRLDLAALIDPDPDVTAYVERYRPPVPPARTYVDPCAYCGLVVKGSTPAGLLVAVMEHIADQHNDY